jgi:hypothetical protein
MAEEDEGRATDLEKRTQEQNSNLKRLIDTVGGLINSSRELLSKLHHGRASEQQAEAPPAADKETGQGNDPRSGPARSED